MLWTKIFIKVTCSKNITNVFWWNAMFLSICLKVFMLFRSQRLTFSYIAWMPMSDTCSVEFCRTNIASLVSFHDMQWKNAKCSNFLYPGWVNTDNDKLPPSPMDTFNEVYMVVWHHFSVFYDATKNKNYFSGEFTHLNPNHFQNHNTGESWKPINGTFTFLPSLHSRVHGLI